MFTGIIKDIGGVVDVTDQPGGGKRLTIATGLSLDELEEGASVACSGACLTVVERGEQDGDRWFAVELSAETLNSTTFSDVVPGAMVNLEPAVRVGEVLNGHLVTGHVDTTARVVSMEEKGDNRVVCFTVASELMPFIAYRGSVTIDGVSLTVIAVKDPYFWVNLIPYTRANSSLGDVQEGQEVNLEVDLIARYVVRALKKGVVPG